MVILQYCNQGEEQIFKKRFLPERLNKSTTLVRELVSIINYTWTEFSIKQPSKNLEDTLGPLK